MPTLSVVKGFTGLTADRGVIDVAFTNYLDDLVAVTHNGVTVKVDFGSNDTITGTSFNDDISTHKGNDIAYGGLGNDVFRDKGLGNDQFFGGDGFDTFQLGAGNDLANGGAGIDTVDYTGLAYTVIADLQAGAGFAHGIDRYAGIENMKGSSWNDTIKGDGGANTFTGADGNDTLMGRRGADALLGGNGNDTLFGNDGKNAPETIRGPGYEDRLFGDAGNDVLFGDAGNDYLNAGTGNDVANGGFGNDFIYGGGGNDVLTGGRGSDTFYFGSLGDMPNADRITDFEKGADKIDLSAIDANPFVAGNQAFKFPSIIHNGDTANGVSVHPGPVIDGHTGYVEFRIRGDLTYVYVETGDHITGAHIVLNGAIQLGASDFVL